MAAVHTQARGTEPYDQVYCLGYQVHHEDWSPYPRINKLRQTFLDRGYDVDVERLRLVTQSYQQHEHLPEKLKVAYAFENVLLHCGIEIYEDDLIVGEIASPIKSAPIYPEFSVNWILDEVQNHPFEQREHDQFTIRSEEEKQEILELCRWWQGRTLDDYINVRLDDDQLKGSEAGKKIYQTNLYHYAGTGHLAVDYARLMQLGFDGLRQRAQQKLAALDMHDPEFCTKREFYQAVLIMYGAVEQYILRYAALAEEMAAREQEAKRKAELEQIAANCRAVAGGVPKTFWQALQLFHFATMLICVESNGHSISYGRMDQWLYPYYEADKGISKEFALELLEVEYVKLNNPTKLKDAGSMALRNGRGFGGESLTIGGVKRDGTDATNDLTMLMLEASAHTRMMNPWVCVRMHEGTPEELRIKAVECIRAGYGHPKLFNDGPAIQGMLRKGMTLEEARDYCVVGCVEISLPGREYGWHDAAYVNTAKMMEMVLNGGRCIDCGPHCPRWSRCGALGKHLGPDTGSLDRYASFEEVKQSVDAQFEYWTNQMCSSLCVIENAHRALKPLPYVSALFEDCLESGHDLTEGGAKYNGIGPQASGMATCADSLAAIRQLVFDEKRCTGAELLEAVKHNWKGYEKLYALVNSSKVHHYGNDDDYADELFRFMFETYCSHITGRKTPRGGTFSPGVYSVNANVAMGLNTNASVDGRKAGEAISDNMGPVHTDFGSHDINGPTAIVNSLTKVDHSLATNGTLMNLRFPQEAVAGIEGRDNLASFIEEYIHKGAMHVQFNIMSAATMRAAQKKPEDYKDMLVRVAGYSAYFVELGKPLQKDLIQRTELHF